jgi:hypothetical protein
VSTFPLNVIVSGHFLSVSPVHLLTAAPRRVRKVTQETDRNQQVEGYFHLPGFPPGENSSKVTHGAMVTPKGKCRLPNIQQN